MRYALRVVAVAVLFSLAGCVAVGERHSAQRASPQSAETHAARTEILNRLRNEINAAYGFRDSAPRINLGPCGRFARDFREGWNARFRDPLHVVFVMSADGSQCHHVLIRLPDSDCYDGGNGVMSERALLTLYPNSRLDDMKTFDPVLLDRRSYGLARSYPECPNYSDDLTARLIDRHLAMLPTDR